SLFADLNAFEIAECISSVWTLIPVQPGAAQEACAAGTAGQIQWTGGLLKYCDGSIWQTISNSGASTALSGITAAAAGHTIANANFAQVWNWDTLTTGTALKIASTSMTTGSLLYLLNTNSAAGGGAVLDVESSAASGGVD